MLAIASHETSVGGISLGCYILCDALNGVKLFDFVLYFLSQDLWSLPFFYSNTLNEKISFVSPGTTPYGTILILGLGLFVLWIMIFLLSLGLKINIIYYYKSIGTKYFMIMENTFFEYHIWDTYQCLLGGRLVPAWW